MPSASKREEKRSRACPSTAWENAQAMCPFPLSKAVRTESMVRFSISSSANVLLSNGMRSTIRATSQPSARLMSASSESIFSIRPVLSPEPLPAGMMYRRENPSSLRLSSLSTRKASSFQRMSAKMKQMPGVQLSSEGSAAGTAAASECSRSMTEATESQRTSSPVTGE